MTATDMAAALDEVQAQLAGAHLVAEVYHWCTNLSLTVPGDGTMYGECRLAALCVKPSGTTIREIGTVVLDYTRTEGTWLFSRQAVTIQRQERAA